MTPPIMIGVPVRNEARRLPAFLASVARLNRTNCGAVSLCLVLDSCTDASEEIVSSWQAPLWLKIHWEDCTTDGVPNAGRARAAALDLAGRTVGRNDEAWLLTSDADTTLSRSWLQAHRQAFCAADVVAGYAKRKHASRNRHRAELENYLERLHRLRRIIDPIEYEAENSHPFMSGASIGTTLRTFRALGGMPPMANGEDEAFIMAARLSGFRVRHDKAVLVHTSSRRCGRAPGGLAAALAQSPQGDAGSQDCLVDDPIETIAQYALDARARTAWPFLVEPSQAAAFAREMNFPIAQVLNAWREAPTADAFVLRAVPAQSKSHPLPLKTASKLLAQLEYAHSLVLAA